MPAEASTLPPAERPARIAALTARRKAIYEELHPETKREATLKKGNKVPSRQVGETGEVDRFTTETARKTGRSERAVQRDAERGEKIMPEAMAEPPAGGTFNLSEFATLFPIGNPNH